MLNRWIGIACAIGMLAANTALVVRDILPAWLAGDPPDAEAGLMPNEVRQSQVGIFDENGREIGQSWTTSRMSGPSLSVQSSTLLRPIRLPNNAQTPLVRIDSDLTYKQSMLLSGLRIQICGLGFPAHIHGDLVPPYDFPCEWQVGEMRGNFLLPAEATRALGDVIRPFDRLPNLYVGRTWRLKLVNPLAPILPGWDSADFAKDAVLVRVTGKETVTLQDGPVECYIVEAPHTKAWVAADGRVLRQSVELPVLGTLTLEEQPYSDAARNKAAQAVPFGG